MIDRCSELLQFAQIDKIYLVFDGLRVPLKSGTNASRESKRQANLKEARRLMACGRRSEAHEKYRMCAKGSEIMARVVAAKVQERWGKDDTGTNDNVRVKCVWSPYEADSQLAKLCVDGWCHAVVTEVCSCVVIGCDEIIYPPFFNLTHVHSPPGFRCSRLLCCNTQAISNYIQIGS